MRRRGWIALVVLILVIIEAGSVLTLYLVTRLTRIRYAPVSVTSISPKYREMLENLLAGKTTYVAHSPTLGWTIKPNGHSPLYRANSKGIRGDREYSLNPSEDVIRISTFGDSFTHSDTVKNEDTWQEALMRINRRLEVINFGVGGFGLDQAFLRYQQEGVAYKSHIVLIGFEAGNVFRSVNVFRPFYVPGTDLPLTKPRFILEGDRLVLLENPMKDLEQYRELLAAPGRVLPRLGAHDYFFHLRYRRGPFDILRSVRLLKLVRYEILDQIHGATRRGFYNPNSEALRVTTAIFAVRQHRDP